MVLLLHIFTSLLRHYYVSCISIPSWTIITCYYIKNGLITLIMDQLLPFITRPIMGNNGFHYYPLLTQECRSATRFRDCSTKNKIKNNLLSPGHMAARRSCRYKTRRNNLCFTDYTKCRSMLQVLIQIWILAFCLCTALFFLLYSVEPNLTLTLVVFPAQQLARHRDISTAR